jgi:hypothetical protein
MLQIQRSSSGQAVFALSGRMDEGNLAGLKILISSEANVCPISLDLKDITMVGPYAVRFLEQCEADGITLKSCAHVSASGSLDNDANGSVPSALMRECQNGQRMQERSKYGGTPKLGK